MKKLAVAVALLVSTPAMAEVLMDTGSHVYLVNPKECATYVNLTDGYITCYDRKGNSTGTEVALNEAQLQEYAAQSAANRANADRALSAMAQTNAQIWGNVNQGWQTLQQGQQAPTVGDYRYQDSSGAWIYCRRMSNSVVNCRQL